MGIVAANCLCTQSATHFTYKQSATPVQTLFSHYNGVIMRAMASQITGVSVVYSTVGSGADQRKHQSSESLASVPVTGEFPTRKASNAENVSIWWDHHVYNHRSIIGILEIPDHTWHWNSFSTTSRLAINESSHHYSSRVPRSISSI